MNISGGVIQLMKIHRYPKIYNNNKNRILFYNLAIQTKKKIIIQNNNNSSIN